MKESNGKIHITWYQAMATILVLGELVGFCACGKETNMKDSTASLNTILESYADDTEIDDVLSDGSSFVFEDEDTHSEDLISYYDLACELDRILYNKEYIQRIFELDGVHLDEIPVLTDAEKKVLLADEESMSTVLIDSYKRKLIGEKEKGSFYAKLKVLDEYYDLWIDMNGLNIAEDVLLDSIKVAACEALDGKAMLSVTRLNVTEDIESHSASMSTLLKKPGEVVSHRQVYSIPYKGDQLGVKTLQEIDTAREDKNTPLKVKFDLCKRAVNHVKKLITKGAKLKKKKLVYER